MHPEPDIALSRLEALCQSGDAEALRVALQSALTAWQALDLPAQLRALRGASELPARCALARTAPIRGLLQADAIRVIDQGDTRELDAQLAVLMAVLRLDSTAQIAAPGQRSASAARWLALWNRIDAQIDPRWDSAAVENQVRPFVPQTDGPFRAGTAPDNVRDPALRAAYQAHLANSAAIAERNREQKALRQLQADYRDTVASYVIGLYAQPPAAADELRAHAAGVSDATLKARLLEASD